MPQKGNDPVQGAHRAKSDFINCLDASYEYSPENTVTAATIHSRPGFHELGRLRNTAGYRRVALSWHSTVTALCVILFS